MTIKLILVIEANNETRIFMEDTLREEGYPVLSSSNAKQADKILTDFPVTPDLIIADSYGTLPEGLSIPLILSSTLQSPLLKTHLLAAVKNFK